MPGAGAPDPAAGPAARGGMGAVSPPSPLLTVPSRSRAVSLPPQAHPAPPRRVRPSPSSAFLLLVRCRLRCLSLFCATMRVTLSALFRGATRGLVVVNVLGVTGERPDNRTCGGGGVLQGPEEGRISIYLPSTNAMFGAAGTPLSCFHCRPPTLPDAWRSSRPLCSVPNYGTMAQPSVLILLFVDRIPPALLLQLL